jgi:hypothetical protein
MRGFALGSVLLVIVVLSVLLGRPGGLRHALRNAARRLRIALLLTGAYLLSSTVLRLAFPNNGLAEAALVVIAAALAITFLIVGQDRPADQR